MDVNLCEFEVETDSGGRSKEGRECVLRAVSLMVKR